MTDKVLVVYEDLAEVQPYRKAVEASGGEPVLHAAEQSLTLGSCSGLLLTGGVDVNPELYGEAPEPQTQDPNPTRDAVETDLINEALSRDIAILAICRGMQILNVCLGGSLVQHLPTTARHVRRTVNRGEPAHLIEVKRGTLLDKIMLKPTLQVNSRHHQAVARLGEGVRICATDPSDGTVEALDLPRHKYVLGVQWHPENQMRAPAQRNLFRSFVEAANGRTRS